MTDRVLDIEKIQKALDRAARAAISGPREARSGRYPNSKPMPAKRKTKKTPPKRRKLKT